MISLDKKCGKVMLHDRAFVIGLVLNTLTGGLTI